jgi:hypothetical protein
MKRLISTLFVLVFLPALAFAQASDYSKGHGYAYFAPGASSPSSGAYAHVGAGGEGFFTRNLGAAAELGYLTPMRSWSDGIGTLSPNFVARFRAKDRDHKLEPFVTGGYTLFFRSGTASGVNFGGGVNYWFNDNVGLRLEVRDNVWTQYATIHYVGFRVGVTFR